jgi:Helicase conserved C-terminal domain
VTIETTDSDRFHAFVVELISFGRLSRMIVDEAHLALLHKLFRPVMKTLQWAGQRDIQIVLQTATMPPSLEERMFHAFGLTTYKVCRTRTCRPNISYNVRRVDDIHKSLLELHGELRAKYPTDSIIIFCRSQDQTKHVAEILGLLCCHAGMTKLEVDSVLSRFRSGEVRTVAATSLLGVALDIPSVMRTIHLDYPHNTMGFIQETGRVARDINTLGWSHTIIPKFPAQPKYPTPDLFGARLIRESIDNTDVCRRIYMMLFNDGVAESCAMMEGVAHLCDVCTRAANTQPRRDAVESYAPSMIERYISTSGEYSLIILFIYSHNNLLASITHSPRQPPEAPTFHPYPAILPPPSSDVAIQLASAHSRIVIPIERVDLPHSTELRKIKSALDKIAPSCILCWLTQTAPEHDHQLKDCLYGQTPFADKDAWDVWRNSVTLSEGDCYGCGCPQHVSS